MLVINYVNIPNTNKSITSPITILYTIYRIGTIISPLTSLAMGLCTPEFTVDLVGSCDI